MKGLNEHSSDTFIELNQNREMFLPITRTSHKMSSKLLFVMVCVFRRMVGTGSSIAPYSDFFVHYHLKEMLFDISFVGLFNCLLRLGYECLRLTVVWLISSFGRQGTFHAGWWVMSVTWNTKKWLSLDIMASNGEPYGFVKRHAKTIQSINM